MAFSNVPEISWKYVGKPYDLNTVLSPDEVWAKLDLGPEEVRQALITLITELQSVVDANSGADNIGMTPITILGAPTTIQSVIEALVTRLQATVDNASGADLIGVTSIVGLTGASVQALLESLKTYIDAVDSVNDLALSNHKTSGDHDGRYYTESEIDSIISTLNTTDTANATNLANHKSSSDHDSRYYTETESDTKFETIDDLTNNRKLSPTGNFTGTLNGYPIVQADPGYSSMVAGMNDTLNAHLADFTQQIPYAVTAGIANTYTVSTTPALPALVSGVAITVKIHAVNTGASTLNWDGKGAKAIKKANGNDVGSGNLKLNGVYTLRYDGTSFILQGEGGEYGTAGVAQVLSGYSVGTETGVIPGTMPNRGTFTLGAGVSVPAGYYSGGTTDDGKPVNVVAGESLIAQSLSTFYFKNTNGATYFKAKEIRVLAKGTIRVRFDLGTYSAYGRIYKNGVAIGTARVSNDVSPVTFTEDITVDGDDLIQLYVYTTNGNNQSVSNFKISADYTMAIPIS